VLQISIDLYPQHGGGNYSKQDDVPVNVRTGLYVYCACLSIYFFPLVKEHKNWMKLPF